MFSYINHANHAPGIQIDFSNILLVNYKHNTILVYKYFIHSLVNIKQGRTYLTRQNEEDWTVSVSLYKSSPERWYDVRYKECNWN